MSVSAVQALRALIARNPNVSLRIGERVFIGYAPQAAAMPFVVLSQVGGRRQHHLRGAAEVAWSNVQVDVVATDEAVGSQLANLVRLSLDAYRGGVTVAGDTTYLRHVALESESGDVQSPQDGNDAGVWVQTQTYQVVQAETVTR